ASDGHNLTTDKLTGYRRGRRGKPGFSRGVLQVQEHRNNLAARAGRWSAANWKKAFFGWLAFVVVATAAGTAAGTKMLKQADTASGNAKKAEQILASAHFRNPASESVLVQSASRTTHDHEFRG